MSSAKYIFFYLIIFANCCFQAVAVGDDVFDVFSATETFDEDAGDVEEVGFCVEAYVEFFVFSQMNGQFLVAFTFFATPKNIANDAYRRDRQDCEQKSRSILCHAVSFYRACVSYFLSSST